MLPVASCYGNRDKLRPDGPFGSNADFIFKNINLISLVRTCVLSARSCIPEVNVPDIKMFCSI